MVLTRSKFGAHPLLMFQRYNPHARRVMVRSEREARALGHNYIGTEHLLLGLLTETAGTAARALDSVGITDEATRDLVIAEVGHNNTPAPEHIPFTPRMKKTLEMALREGSELSHDYIGTEHLLLGMLRVQDSRGTDLLHRQGVEPATARQAVLDLLARARRDERPRRPDWLRPQPDIAAADAPRTTQAAYRSLEVAGHYAGAEAVGSHHLLLASLSDPLSAAVKALTNIGIDPDTARQALRDVDVTGTSDELPEQAGRRLFQLRVSETTLVVETTDPVLVEQAHATLASLDQPTRDTGLIRGDLDACTSLADVWQALRLSLKDIQRRAEHPPTAPANAEAD